MASDRQSSHSFIHSFIYSFIQLTLSFSSVPHTVQGDGDIAVNNRALVPLCLDLTFLKPNQSLPPPVWEIFVSTVSPGDFPGCLVVKTLCFQCRGVWVQSLVGELISLMPHGSPPKKKNKTTTVSPGPSFLLLCADLRHSPNSYVEILTPAPQNVTVFGDRMLREAIMLK